MGLSDLTHRADHPGAGHCVHGSGSARLPLSMSGTDTEGCRPASLVSTTRLPELDSVRGIAALVVLCSHVLKMTGWALPRSHFVSVLVERTPLQIFEDGRAPVLFFFVLSGYVLTLSLLRSPRTSLLQFALQRTVRLLLPVAASVLLSVGLYAILFDPVVLETLRPHTLYTWWAPPTPVNVLEHVFLFGADPDLRLNVVLWSLVHEWRISVLLPLVLIFHHHPLRLLLIGIATHGAAAFLVGQDTVQLGPTLPFSPFVSLYFSLALLAGASLALAGPVTWLMEPWDRRLAALAALALFSLESDMAVFVGSVFLIMLAQQPGRFRTVLTSRLLTWIGKISFSLYLVHTVILQAALHALHDKLPLSVIAATGALLSFLVAALFYRGVELPAQTLARQVGRRFRLAAGP